MPPSTYNQPDDIDLGALWYSALRSLPKLAVLAAILAAVTYGVLSLMAPRYVSETQLAIESVATNNPFTDPSRSGGSDSVSVRMDKEAINTHVRALMSTNLGEMIVRDMKLADLAEFNAAKGATDTWSALLRLVGIGVPKGSQTDQERALDAYFKHLEVYSPKESRFIGIRFSSMDPELAAAVANRIAETYRLNMAHQSLTETDEVQKALEPKITKLADEAAEAEAAVEKFRGEANIFKGGQQATGLNEQQLSELNAELSRVKAARSEAEARAKQAREMQQLGSAETLADVQKSPLIQNLVQSRVRVERQISELSATLLPGHPRMRQLSADLKGLKAQISAEVAKIVDGIGKEAKVAALREEAIQKSVADIKTRIVTSGPEEAKLRSLEADARSKRAELDRLRAQFEANRVRADDSRTIPVEAQIVSSARPSGTPVFPRKSATALLVGVATLMIGLALVITRGLLGGTRVARVSQNRVDRRDESARNRQRAQPSLSLPELNLDASEASPPMEQRLAKRVDEIVKPEKPADVATAKSEAILVPQAKAIPETRAAAENATPIPDKATAPEASVQKVQPADPVVVPAAVRQPDAVVANIHSAEVMAATIEAIHKSGESGTRTLIAGSTDVFTLANEAAAIGSSLTEKGRSVIIVDWSLNGGGIAEPLGLPSWPGFNELADGRARFEDVVSAVNGGDVHIIPCGKPRPNPSEPLDSDNINFLLDALDDVYEHIVVVSRKEAARRLFEAIQGRFDCGVTLVADEAQAAKLEDDGAAKFLGFDVEGISLFTLEPSEVRPRSRQKIARAG